MTGHIERGTPFYPNELVQGKPSKDKGMKGKKDPVQETGLSALKESGSGVEVGRPAKKIKKVEADNPKNAQVAQRSLDEQIKGTKLKTGPVTTQDLDKKRSDAREKMIREGVETGHVRETVTRGYVPKKSEEEDGLKALDKTRAGVFKKQLSKDMREGRIKDTLGDQGPKRKG